ncbi:hypothetical protein [uncultured Roseobacter sp.]|uniref:hypothetical protein n=1 Tax=uncultured Roseobacter sp. TaxID=114847 RepID=UPI002622E361|nr:hypothetical protein [uncultured Roseobacter sp.]
MKKLVLEPSERGHPSATDVANSVSEVMKSGVLGKSDRRARLLGYLVDQELAGKGPELTAFSIAVDVLGRDASFEASTDSIVRSEVGRLRDALRLHFAEAEHSDHVRIDIPKGTYRPVFSFAKQRDKASVGLSILGAIALGMCTIIALISIYVFDLETRSYKNSEPISLAELPYEVVRISVETFEGRGGNPSVNKLAFGIYSELIMDLSVYPWISIISPTSPMDDKTAIKADYILSGDTFWEGDTLKTHAQLVSLPDSNVIWSNNLTLTASSETIKEGVIRVSGQIAALLGSAHGIAPELARSRTAQTSTEGLEAFLCYLGLHSYLTGPTDEKHYELRSCLAAAVEEFPNFGDAWAALGIIYMDESRFERNARPNSNPWQEAENAIDQALKYAPARMPTLNAALIYSIEAPSQNLEDFERFSALLLDLFPRHPPTLFNVGSRTAEFAGEWETGLGLVDLALALEPRPPTSFFITKAYNAALTGTEKEALFSVQSLTTRTSKSELLLNFLAASRNGLHEDVDEYRQLLAAEGLADDEDILMHVRGRRYTSELEAAILTQLEEAFRVEASNK